MSANVEVVAVWFRFYVNPRSDHIRGDAMTGTNYPRLRIASQIGLLVCKGIYVLTTFEGSIINTRA